MYPIFKNLYCFKLTAQECFYQKTGRCPVTRGYSEPDDKNCCYELGQRIMKYGFNPETDYLIRRFTCGYYRSNMQHRTCIMKKLKISIPDSRVTVDEQSIFVMDGCADCDYITRIKAAINKFRGNDFFHA